MRRLWNERSLRASWGTVPDHGRWRWVDVALAGCRAVPGPRRRVRCRRHADDPRLRRAVPAPRRRHRSACSLASAGELAELVAGARTSRPRPAQGVGVRRRVRRPVGSTTSTAAGRQFAAARGVVVAPRRHRRRARRAPPQRRTRRPRVGLVRGLSRPARRAPRWSRRDRHATRRRRRRAVYGVARWGKLSWCRQGRPSRIGGSMNDSAGAATSRCGRTATRPGIEPMLADADHPVWVAAVETQTSKVP